MKRIPDVLLLVLLLSITPRAQGTSLSPPGKPALIRCRSPEKETFTCWWEPGSDGGLPTTYALYYRKESSDTVYECPDYHTAGENSCFFNKNDTSIWINYNITVVATNALGSTFSDPVDIDVVYIVKPNPPEKVAVAVMEDKGWPFLRVSWEPPLKADTRSGWITLIYELRVRLDGEEEWEMHLAGQQKMFNIFSLRSGGTYHIQVRCKPDHGFWSEWSSTSYVTVPDYFHREKSTWILITVFCAFIFLILTWLLHINSHSLKHCILPPIPGPKIRGFDKQLLKSGKSEDIFSALLVSGFPPTSSSNCEDLLVEYLEVYVPEEQELMLEEAKDLRESGGLKSDGSASDNDSGRGSCDSHTLLMDKCRRPKEERMGPEESPTEAQRHPREWGGGSLPHRHDNLVSPDMSGGRVKTWPSVFSPLPRYSSGPLSRMSSLETVKPHRLSDSVFPQSSSTSCLSRPPRHGVTEEAASRWEPRPQRPLHPPQAHGDFGVSGLGPKQASVGPQPQLPPLLRPTEYVEVQRVNEEDMVLLQPLEAGRCRGDGFPRPQHEEEEEEEEKEEEDYSKVKAVNGDNALLLQKEAEGGRVTQKPAACAHAATPTRGDAAPTVSGYVDTATAFTLPAF